MLEDTTPSDVRPSSVYVQLYHPTPIKGDFAGKHIVTVEQFSRDDLQQIIATTDQIKMRVLAHDRELTTAATGRVMATLFYEASTRTDMSFQAAMRRLGGEVVGASNGVRFSSVYKGENLADTVRAAGCYADVIALRHPEVGSSYEAAYYLDRLNQQISRRCVVVSGGDGVGEHPTQALLDLYTIVAEKGTLDSLTITMVGDLRHGRTVHSLAKLLALYGATNVTLGLVAPEALRMPPGVIEFLQQHGITQIHQTANLHDLLGQSDVIYWTRVQEERFIDPNEYLAIRDSFVMTPPVLAGAKADTILMHPLPRKYEMGTPTDHDVLDTDPRAVYFRQMENGMFVRMALLAKILGLSYV